MQVSHWNGPRDGDVPSPGGPPSEGSGELSLRAAEAGGAGRSSVLLTRAGGEAGGTPEPPGGGGGPTLGGPGGPTWGPDWDALLERTTFRREEDNPFAVSRPNWSEASRLLADLRARDLVLLGMLYQHRYLSSKVLAALFWPGYSHRGANRRLNELYAQHRLIFRWRQEAPRRRGAAARRPYVYLLSSRGAAVLAQTWRLDPKAVIKRAWRAAHHPARIHHDLFVSELFAGLAVVAAGWSGCGLYHWIGDDAMRRNHELIRGSLAPDGWGRLLLPNRELTFNLEWDAGTEGNLPLVSKLKVYADQLPPGEHVLFVAPNAPRERSIRETVRYVLQDAARDFPLLTTHAGTLQEGLLAAIWSPIGEDETQLSLLEVPARARSDLDVTYALAKPYWWERRPGGGEGA